MSKKHKLRFHLGYFVATIVLFLIEVVIAKFASGWIRAYFGDVLVVMLIYTAVMSVIDLDKRWVILGTLLFSFMVEVAQYFGLAELLGFAHGSVGYIVLGHSFSWIDLLCYAVGCLLIWRFERPKIGSYSNV